MKEWRAREAKVKAQAGTDIPALERWVSCPRPKAHPIVESAVNENDEADFEIVDDGPTAEQKLASRKMELLGEVSEAEKAAVFAVMPFGKRRLLAIREREILLSEQTIKQGFLAKMIGKTSRDPAQDRTPADAQFMAEQQDRRDRITAIERAAAQAMSDIEDLTLDTIGAWKCPSF